MSSLPPYIDTHAVHSQLVSLGHSIALEDVSGLLAELGFGGPQSSQTSLRVDPSTDFSIRGSSCDTGDDQQPPHRVRLAGRRSTSSPATDMREIAAKLDQLEVQLGMLTLVPNWRSHTASPQGKSCLPPAACSESECECCEALFSPSCGLGRCGDGVRQLQDYAAGVWSSPSSSGAQAIAGGSRGSGGGAATQSERQWLLEGKTQRRTDPVARYR